MIHPNVCFLILLICCWVVTASLMAEKTNVGVAVFAADNTYVCCCGSDGATVLLSACSLVLHTPCILYKLLCANMLHVGDIYI